MPDAIEPLNTLFGTLLQELCVPDADAKYLVIFCHNIGMLNPLAGGLVKKFPKRPCKLIIVFWVWFKTYDW